MSKLRHWVVIGFFIGAVGVITYFAGYPIAYRLSYDTIVCTIVEKDDKPKPGQEAGSTYMVWCKPPGKDVETFEVTDSAVFFSWDASDRRGSLKRGGTYELGVAGWRVQLFSMYRNIIDYQLKDQA